MNLFKIASFSLVAISLMLVSCDKEDFVKEDVVELSPQKLNDSDLEVGVRYALSEMSPEFIEEMQLTNYMSIHAPLLTG